VALLEKGAEALRETAPVDLRIETVNLLLRKRTAEVEMNMGTDFVKFSWNY